jgi:hypothetical protein
MNSRAIKASFSDMNAMLADLPGLQFQGNGPNFVQRSIPDFLTRFNVNGRWTSILA